MVNRKVEAEKVSGDSLALTLALTFMRAYP